MVCTCVAYNCNSKSVKNCSLSLHRFPQDPQTREKWIIALRRKDFNPTEHSRLCSKHFTQDCFQIRPNASYPLLNSDAVPTIFQFPPNVGRTAIKKRRAIEKYEDNEVKSKKRKPTKSAPKKDGRKKKAAAAKAGDRDGSPDEEKDCDESIDVEESDVYVKQEVLEPEITDDVKPLVITVSSLHSCEAETIVPEIVPVVIKSEPTEEEEETTSAAVDDTSNDDMESKGWKCTSLGCNRVFRNKNKMQLHAKGKHSWDDKVNGGNMMGIKEEDSKSTFGLLSLETFPTPVGSTNAATTANWSMLSPHNLPPMVASSSLSSTKVITAPINSLLGDPSGTRKYLVMIPTQSPATVGGMAGVWPPQHPLLPIQVSNPSPSLSPPTSPQVTPPLRPTMEQLTTQPPSADSSETLTISLSQFDERTRVGLKKKILELLDAVGKRKLDPDDLVVVYYNSDKNKSVPSAMKRRSGKTAKK